MCAHVNVKAIVQTCDWPYIVLY